MMNTRRQTIWLVSMLSLMVILSAYYLFTDNVGEVDIASEHEDQHTTILDAVEVTEHSELSELDELLALAAKDQQVGDQTVASGGESAVISGGDQRIIDKVKAGAQTGEEVLAAIDMQRTEALKKETERLMEIALDPKKSVEEVASAENQLQQIEENQARVSDLEDQLMREYENVIITEDKGLWNVIVQTDKMQRSEVVTIIDMVNEELQVSPSRISVEYVK